MRFWVLDAGTNGPLSFHVIGDQFDTVWKEGGFVDLTFTEPGHYPFVNHVMANGEKGAHAR